MRKPLPYVIIGFALLAVFPLAAQSDENQATIQEGEHPAFHFQTTIALGAKTFNEEDGEVTYSMISFTPDLSFGKVGIGLDLTLHYQSADGFEVREEDWVPKDGKSFLDLYLPIFRYVRYGEKGDDLYAKIGTIEDGTLGNGFIMRNYSNALFLPEQRIVGLALDIDGRLFNFPYIGLETFTGNLARFDVFGTRLYARPLAATELPLLNNLQIGVSYAADFDPEANYDFTVYTDSDTVSMFDVDFQQPLLTGDLATLVLFGDVALQTGDDDPHSGAMTGFGGTLWGFLQYGFSLLFLGDNFVPFYFDATYDLYREAKYAIYSGELESDGYNGWMTVVGFSFLGDMLAFSTTVDGSFAPDNSTEDTKLLTYPHLRGTLSVGEGLLPGFFFDAFYDKRYINSFDDFGDPENATIGAEVNYKTGPAVITLGYNLRYVPEDGSWETSSSLTSSISF
ncbi:hypothetical protein [Sediminispirochaeta smaragdinae]|uniref:Alginate export domain-containing protein n=1 Tax=Sediminispirochaeta smaragdinae (strain DSM 11293 / JCM 15392 / SEBR 4228) TaxID=573413 RepID=E1R1U8_SEDSS|nr:hypothetical protein [Sediminispirochaeta smaragdinae]ADK81474.1 hypothetical protein Spirs_2359 [Sediminispirochaeta smaragdinae DSM 11293]